LTTLFPSHDPEVRREFNNDPGAFIAAAESVEGKPLFEKLGLLKEAPAPSEPEVKPDGETK